MNVRRARAAYIEQFDEQPKLMVRAPGRVNLIGEHTDYNDGFVLPCAIDRDTVVAVGPSDDGMLHSVAADFSNEFDISKINGGFTRSDLDWANYVRGVAAVLTAEGVKIAGAKLAIAGDVPLGSGLSSSASLEVAVGYALSAIAGVDINPDRMALIAQRAENIYVGCQCGIMDQLISARGIADHALLIDCRSLECRPVALPVGVSVLIAHSGVRHAHADGEYNDRRAECSEAALHYGVPALRDLDIAALEAGKSGLRDVAYRRARHVVSENMRTVAAADALTAGDLRALGQLMEQSHISMRDDFEITVPAVDELVRVIAEALGKEGGARMTGGGFGGCVVAVAPDERVNAVRDAVARFYRTPDGSCAEFFVCKATGGAERVDAN